jgi:hypothetical protein
MAQSHLIREKVKAVRGTQSWGRPGGHVVVRPDLAPQREMEERHMHELPPEGGEHPRYNMCSRLAVREY